MSKVLEATISREINFDKEKHIQVVKYKCECKALEIEYEDEIFTRADARLRSEIFEKLKDYEDFDWIKISTPFFADEWPLKE